MAWSWHRSSAGGSLESVPHRGCPSPPRGARPAPSPGRLRKQIIKPSPETPALTSGEIDIASMATVQVTSEDPEHPVDHAFDDRRGPGGSRWVAGEPGEQAVSLA